MVQPIGGEFQRVTIPAQQAALIMSNTSITRRMALMNVLAPPGSSTPATHPREAPAYKWMSDPVSIKQNHVANGPPGLY